MSDNITFNISHQEEMSNRDNKTVRVSCRISQPDFMLLEAVAKRGGYATLSELMRDSLIHMSHTVLNRAAYPNRSTELATPELFRPVGCREEEMTIKTDIRSLFNEAQSMGTEFEDDMRKRKSK